MGFEINMNFDDFEKNVHAQISDQMHEAMAAGLAEKAREHGLNNADTINLEIESDTEHPDLQIDAERVRARANEILAAD